MPPTPRPDNLVWIDLEMTGLDPTVDVILQAALVITTADLEPWTRSRSTSASRPRPWRACRVRARHAHAHGLVDRVLRSTVEVAEWSVGCSSASARGCPSPATFVRKLDLERSPLHRALHARPRAVPALPRRRRVQRQGAGRAVGTARRPVFAKPTAGAHDATVDVKSSIRLSSGTTARTLFIPRAGAAP